MQPPRLHCIRADRCGMMGLLAGAVHAPSQCLAWDAWVVGCLPSSACIIQIGLLAPVSYRLAVNNSDSMCVIQRQRNKDIKLHGGPGGIGRAVVCISIQQGIHAAKHAFLAHSPPPMIPPPMTCLAARRWS